jgi:hypothetical protein
MPINGGNPTRKPTLPMLRFRRNRRLVIMVVSGGAKAPPLQGLKPRHYTPG